MALLSVWISNDSTKIFCVWIMLHLKLISLKLLKLISFKEFYPCVKRGHVLSNERTNELAHGSCRCSTAYPWRRRDEHWESCPSTSSWMLPPPVLLQTCRAALQPSALSQRDPRAGRRYRCSTSLSGSGRWEGARQITVSHLFMFPTKHYK